MVEEHAQGDIAGVGNGGLYPQFLQGVVQAHLPLVHQLQDHGGDEGLGYAPYVEPQGGVHGLAGLHVGQAYRRLPGTLAGNVHVYDGPGYAVILHDPAQLILEPPLYLGWKGGGAVRRILGAAAG